jgi:hypothetical protein
MNETIRLGSTRAALSPVLTASCEQDGAHLDVGADSAHIASFRGGGPRHETGCGIALASDGRIFVSGSCQSFAEFGGATTTAIAPSTGNDGVVVGFRTVDLLWHCVTTGLDGDHIHRDHRGPGDQA